MLGIKFRPFFMQDMCTTIQIILLSTRFGLKMVILYSMLLYFIFVTIISGPGRLLTGSKMIPASAQATTCGA